MKKLIILLVIFTMLGATLSAQRYSVGGGVIYDKTFKNGLSSTKDSSAFYGEDLTAYGGYFFADYEYFTTDISLVYSSITLVKEAGGIRDTLYGGFYFNMGVSFSGKIPINIGLITLFPMIGINYNIALGFQDGDGKTYIDVSEFFSQGGFHAGAGIDINLGSFFLRAEGLYIIRLPMKYWIDEEKRYSDGKVTFPMGYCIKVGFGIKL